MSQLLSDALLTPRETEILLLIEQGRRLKYVAEACDIAVGTVKVHIRNIRMKLGADPDMKTSHLRKSREESA